MAHLEEETENDDSKKKLPIGLGILVIVQLLFFFTVQLDNYRYRQMAINYYFDTGLNKTEFPLYIRYLYKNMANNVFYQRLETISSGNVQNIELYWLIRYDPFFQTSLTTDAMPDNTLYYVNWQQKRQEYQRLLNKDIVQTYAFSSAKPSVVKIFVSLFSTENYIQFIVNTLFLIIGGLLLEAKIGAFWLIGGYVLGGVMMISLYCFLAPFSLIPVAATNGGVIFLLGLLTTLYGARKEKIYYYNGKRFTSVYVACFAFLPFWLVVEYALFYLGMINTTNIASQLSPLIGGALLGFYLKGKLKSQLTDEETIPGTDELKERFDLASRAVADLNYDEAKKIYYDLLSEYPTNKDVHMALFNIVKSKPFSDEYHEIVKKIFSLKDMSNTTTATINSVFDHYLKRAQPAIRIDVETFFSLMQRFRKSGYYEDAIKILKVLVQKNEQGKLSESLAREQLLLARGFFLKNDTVKGNELINSLLENFPETESAKQVQTMIAAKKDFSS